MSETKSKEIRDVINKFAKDNLGMTLDQARNNGLCVTCHRMIGPFTDVLSKKEYDISGLCQDCQDETFG